MLKTTNTNFDYWIEHLEDFELTDIDNLHSLYLSVKDVSPCGLFNCNQNKHNKQFFVTCDLSESEYALCLSTEKSKDAFLRMLDNRCGGGFLEESHYYRK